MFSKKKDKIFAWLDRALKERRKSFRYTPEAVAIFVQVGEKAEAWPVLNLSAGGFCFHHPHLGAEDVFTLRLQSRTEELPLDLFLKGEVLGRTRDGECHCAFVDLTADEEDTLHRFTLAAQRHEARRQRLLRVQRLREKN